MKKTLKMLCGLMCLLSAILITMSGCDLQSMFSGPVEVPIGDGFTPIYYGMLMSTSPDVEIPPISYEEVVKGNQDNNGNHYGWYKNPDKDKENNGNTDNNGNHYGWYKDDNGDGKLDEDFESQICYLSQNQDVYFYVGIGNPAQLEIVSFKVNGQTYTSDMFEANSTNEVKIVKYNVGNASGIVEYSIDEIKYFDGTEIKDVVIAGNRTAKAGIKVENAVAAIVNNIELRDSGKEAFFDIAITDEYGFIANSNGVITLTVYRDGKSVKSEKLIVGENEVAIKTLNKNKEHEYEIVAYYDDLSGVGPAYHTLVSRRPLQENHTHTFGDWKVVKETTCTEDGEKTRTCSACGEIETEIIKTPGKHSWGDWKVTKEATCTEDGEQERVCSACGEIEAEIIKSPDKHAWGDWKVTKEATCTEDGEKTRTCSACGEIEKEAIIARGYHSFGAWETIREVTCVEDGEKKRTCSACEFTETEKVLAPGSHTEVIDKSVAPTCTETGLTEGKHCSRCTAVLVVQTIVPAIGHVVVIQETVVPTLTEPGLTQGKYCSACNQVLVAQVIIPVLEPYENPALYNDDYGYHYLGTMSNGKAMQNLYNSLDKVAVAFHIDTTINAESNVVGSFDFATLGLTENEAIAVWVTYKNDHPLYYWISTSLSVAGTELFLLTENEYSQGSDRAIYNASVYNGVTEYIAEVSGETSSYRIALAFHDAIIYAIDYAYEANGYTPQDDIWAHNILGVFEKQSGVCEAYARTFQLLLNRMDIENIFATGDSSGENHAWNLVQMDDGNWYWFDLTWDDTPDWMWGISYNYFCVNDSQNVNWSDGGWVNPEASFLDTHTLSLPTNQGVDFLYGLPARSVTVYDSDELLLRETFRADGLEYAVVGYNDVALINAFLSGDVIIPESVLYNGIVYEVIAIGGMADGLFNTFGVLESGAKATSIQIPKTVCFIWDQAFRYMTIENILVSQDNPYFTSRDGVLFTKSLYTLIQYPFGNKRTSYVIPNEVVDIADYSFGFGEKLYLESLTIGPNVSGVGITNWGSGYLDQDPIGGIVNILSGGFVRMYDSLCGERKLTIDGNNLNYYTDGIAVYTRGEWQEILCILDTNITAFEIPATAQTIDGSSNIETVFYRCLQLQNITVAEGNPWFSAYDGILYNKEMTEIIHVPQAIKGRVTLPNSLNSIDGYAFTGRSSLMSITIPENVTSIDWLAFCDCYNLVEVYNLSHYITVTKGDSSNGYVGYYAFDVYTSKAAKSKLFADENGYIFYPEGDTYTLIGYQGSEVELIFPATCKGVNYTIKEFAFYRCGMTSITIPDGITIIGEYAFACCDALKSVTIPNSVMSIGDSAFADCGALKSVTIPNGVISIGNRAFSDCDALTSITIPNSVTSIGDYAFMSCSSLTSITVDGENPTYYSEGNCIIERKNKTLILGCRNSAIPDGVTCIGKYAFSDCGGLASITIPNSVTSIGEFAFYGCGSLVSITIPDNVTSIGGGAFYGCSGLTSITIPKNVWSIGASAFDSCSSLTNITIPDGIMNISDNVFSDCSSLTSITIPNSVISIGNRAFYSCSSLRSITLGNSVTSIDGSAFLMCYNLTSITISDSVTRIGNDAFRGCSSLTNVIFEGTTEQWSTIALGYDWNSGIPATEVICSDGVVSLVS